MIKFYRLELSMLTVQKRCKMVTAVHDILQLVWKTYHYSPKSMRELRSIGEQLDVKVRTPSSVKGTRWAPHFERALGVLLSPKKNGDMIADAAQYAAVYTHMQHLAVGAANVDVKGRAIKVS